MGRKSADSTTQTAAKTKPSGSNSSKSSKLVKPLANKTLKPVSKSLKKPRIVESDEEEVNEPPKKLPVEQEKTTGSSTTTRKTVDDEAKPSTLKQSKSKAVKPVAHSVEATGSEESEEEWVGFGNVSGETGEDEDGSGEEDSGSSEEELLHGLSSEDDQDSSDEEIEHPGLDVSKLPTIAKDDKVVKQKLEKAKRKPVRIASTAILRFLCN